MRNANLYQTLCVNAHSAVKFLTLIGMALSPRLRGNCQLAVQELKSYANQGRGYEDAQTAFGVCQMIEAGFNPTDKEQTPSLIEDPAFIEGRRFVLKAAQSGFHEAPSRTRPALPDRTWP